MNRNKDLSDYSAQQFIKLTSLMSEEDEIAIYEASMRKDDDKVNALAKKYGFVFVKTVEGARDDERIEKVAASLVKNGIEKFHKIKRELSDATAKHYSAMDRMSTIPLDDFEKLVNEARGLERSFYARADLNSIFDAINGENANLITKVAIIMDVIGCLSLRNDLLVFHEKLISQAASKYIIEEYNKKKVISDEKSKARKGKTNRHHDEVLIIAKDTWVEYPNASIKGLAEEIYFHLRKSWVNNDLPKISTIETWLKASDFLPEVDSKDRNRNFKLIVRGV